MTDDVPDPVASSAPTSAGTARRHRAQRRVRGVPDRRAIFPVAGATAGAVPAVVHPDTDQPVEDE